MRGWGGVGEDGMGWCHLKDDLLQDHGDERRGQRTRGRGDVHQVARHLTCMWGRYSEKNIIHTVPLLHLLIMHGSKGLLKYPRGIILYSPRKTLKHRMRNPDIHLSSAPAARTFY